MLATETIDRPSSIGVMRRECYRKAAGKLDDLTENREGAFVALLNSWHGRSCVSPLV